ncbi:MAG: hypothetical protein M5U01_19195 [Ardenticatenaceae bacterium]|nr:hypothetical protein [Ardenticatenaceae bacterium]
MTTRQVRYQLGALPVLYAWLETLAVYLTSPRHSDGKTGRDQQQAQCRQPHVWRSATAHRRRH